jgi:hypothetical protein
MVGFLFLPVLGLVPDFSLFAKVFHALLREGGADQVGGRILQGLLSLRLLAFFKPGQAKGHAVLTERRVSPDRASAGGFKFPILLPETDPIRSGSCTFAVIFPSYSTRGPTRPVAK